MTSAKTMKFMRLLCVAVASVKMALTGIASFTGGVVMAAVTPAGEVPTEIPPGTKFGLVDNGGLEGFRVDPDTGRMSGTSPPRLIVMLNIL